LLAPRDRTINRGCNYPDPGGPRAVRFPQEFPSSSITRGTETWSSSTERSSRRRWSWRRHDDETRPLRIRSEQRDVPTTSSVGCAFSPLTTLGCSSTHYIHATSSRRLGPWAWSHIVCIDVGMIQRLKLHFPLRKRKTHGKRL